MDKFLLKLIPQETWDKYFPEVYETIAARLPPGWTEAMNPPRNITVTIVMTCMDRLEHLKETLPQNMDDNPDAEFILLDYNSKDGLQDWVQKNMMPEILTGRLSFYRTEEPKFYSMAHSRNIAFKLAKTDLVSNVDADHFTTKSFDRRLKDLANIYNNGKVVFVKSRQKKRGRIGMWKSEFMKLGGYNEQLIGYGFDDQDLIYRAVNSGFRMVIFGGEYYRPASDHSRHSGSNYKYDWRYTERLNTMVSLVNIASGRLVANEGEHWGKAHLIKNFKEEIDI